MRLDVIIFCLFTTTLVTTSCSNNSESTDHGTLPVESNVIFGGKPSAESSVKPLTPEVAAAISSNISPTPGPNFLPIVTPTISPVIPALVPIQLDLLGPDDFSYLGSYTFNADSQMTFGMGLTIRYVNSELRFLSMSYSGSVSAKLVEFKLPAGGYGTNIGGAQITNSWDNIWYLPPAPGAAIPTGTVPGIGGGDQYSLWWETLSGENGRLWTTHSADYPSDAVSVETKSLAIRTLNADGTISDLKGEFGFDGVGQRAIYGGVQKIPDSFRSDNGLTQKYLLGWGGYTSRMAQGLVPSLGIMALAIPDIATYPLGNTIIPASDFKIIADHRSGTSSAVDWYIAPGAPTFFDRGVRNTNVINYYDGGDNRANPAVAPTLPAAPGAQWLSSAPDGKGRMVWGDSFYNTGNWIVGEKKQGFIAILTAAAGKAYYMHSTLNSDSRDAELQIFNPKDFGQALQGLIKPWNIQPTSTKLLSGDLKNQGLLFGLSGNSPSGGVAGAAYDPKTKTLWLWCPGVNAGYGSLLVAYKVNS